MDEPVSILCVDDEPNVLEGLERTLFEHFDVTTATSGAEALATMEDEEFAVIVSDMRMPQMDGAELLSRARSRWPDTTRVLLTGQTDMTAAVKAVNEGSIFRFLCKPCPPDLLIGALSDAAAQHRLVRAERDLLDRTLSGAATLLTEALSIAAPAAFSRAGQLRAYVAHMARKLELDEPWEYELAALLSRLGDIAVPPDTLDRVYAGRQVSGPEQQMLDEAPAVGQRLLGKVPRLETVAAMIGAQAAGRGDDDDLSERVRLGGAMLRVARAVDRRVLRGASLAQACEHARRHHDPRLVDALADFRSEGGGETRRRVAVRDLACGMVLDEPVRSTAGNVLVGADHTLTPALLERLRNFARGVGVAEPIRVRVSAPEGAGASDGACAPAMPREAHP